jgi:phosphonate transport system substrate-binding protein
VLIVKRSLAAVAAVAALFALAPAAHADRSSWPATLRLGLIVTEANTLDRWQGVTTYLEQQLGVKIRSYVGSDYTAVIIAAKKKDVDLMWLGPESYVLATTEGAPITAIVKYVKNGTAGYHSLLITRADSGIQTIADAKGKTFAFNDPASTSGYLLPMIYFLKELKVKPEEYFSRVTFLGSHEATALAVATGKVAVSSNNDVTLPHLVASGKIKEQDIRVLWKSSLIPSDPIAVQTSLPDDLRAAIQNAFTQIKDRAPAAVKDVGYDGWVVAEDADYNIIRQLNADKVRLLGK